MNCAEFEKQLEEADLSPPSLSSGMEAHRQDCVACAKLTGDLNQITRQARLLVPKEEPSVQVWQRIQQQLRQEGLIQAPAPFPFSPAARVRIGWFPRLQMGMAYAAMFLMGLGVVYLYSVGTIPGFLQEPPITVATVLTAPVEQSLSESDEPILQLIEKAPQEKRATYVMNLNQVNSSIHQWNTFLAEHPGDGFAREQLLNTYQQKERLWNTLLNWEEF